MLVILAEAIALAFQWVKINEQWHLLVDDDNIYLLGEAAILTLLCMIPKTMLSTHTVGGIWDTLVIEKKPRSVSSWIYILSGETVQEK